MEVEVLEHNLRDAFAIPESIWERQYVKSTGYYQGSTHKLPGNEIEGKSTAFRFLIKTPGKDGTSSKELAPKITYRWTEIGFCTQYRQGHSSVLLCLVSDPVHTGFVETIRASVLRESHPETFIHPFGWHTYIIPQVSRAFNSAVWQSRDLVREVETTRADGPKRQIDFTSLHELSRHVMHSTETLAMAINVTNRVLEDLGPAKFGRSSDSFEREEIQQVITCHRMLLQCEHGRSQALENRLRNQIDLHDSMVASQIAELARADSVSMKGISILGLVFLPGTFVSVGTSLTYSIKTAYADALQALFGMNFFDLAQNHQGQYVLAVSSNFWLYWAVTVPLTLGTVLLWQLWYRRAIPRPRSHNPFIAQTPKLLMETTTASSGS
ncbi:hypothetical protein D0861_01936 [Hortaea werneckii]|uniref:Uncharacterized protein n=1 Tax=Hortaea werneckii TaxID=91943 RepID=A0A3M7FX23_HORWE|nr:hypothetical protein D0861_01936 [Hortaea werneckii]